jgi:signal transduction histidine kinase
MAPALINSSLLASFILYLALGVWLYTKRQKNDYIPSLMAITLWSSLWALGVLLFRIISVEYEILYLLNGALYLFAALIASSFLKFALHLADIKRTYSILERVILNFPALATVFLVSIYSLNPSVFEQGTFRGVTLGFGFYIYAFFIMSYFTAGLIALAHKYKRSSGHERKVVAYSLASSTVTGAIDVSFNLLLIPFINYKLLWAGPMSGFFWCIILAYAITKHELVSVSVVISRTLSVAIMVSLVTLSILIPFYFMPLKPLLLIAVAIFWAIFGNKLRLFIQTPLQKKFISGFYDPSDVIHKITNALIEVQSNEEALNKVSLILKERLEISEINLVKQKTESGHKKPVIVVEDHSGYYSYLVIGKKMSEDSYTNKDLLLFESIQDQLRIVMDRIQKHSEVQALNITLEGINKSLEEQVQNQVDKIRVADRKIKALEQDRLRAEKIASQSQLFQEYNHEIRTPLTKLLVEMQLYDPDLGDDEPFDDFRDECLKNLRRINDIVDTTYTLSEGKYEVKCESLDLNEIISKCVALNDSKSIIFSKNLSNIPRIDGVEKELMMALNNLIKNSIDAFESDDTNLPSISIHTSLSDYEICVSVKDNGPGISEEMRTRMWYPFVSSHVTRGRGLGLSSVQRIVNDHNGRVEVESELGQGAEFKLFFLIPSEKNDPNGISKTKKRTA